MSGQIALFDLNTMLLLEDAGGHLGAGMKSSESRVTWPGLACDCGQFVWYTLLTRCPYTATMLERHLGREREAFVADVLNEAAGILREGVHG